MADFTANHICKNKNCTKGTDGGRKHYYACNYCARTLSWRSVACSLECYNEYVAQVIESRSKNKKVNILPERTDMTTEEMKKNIFDKPVEKVFEETKEELSDYINAETSDFSSIVDKINLDLDNKALKNSRKRKQK